MTCRIINSTWKYIDVVRLDPAEDVLVARVNGSTISQPLSPRVTTSMSSGNVVVDFTAVECTDAGNYVCVLNDDASVKIQSPDSVLQVRRSPSVPMFDLNAHQVIGSSLNRHHRHKCSGDVGYPAGEFKVQYAASGSSVFSELSVSNIQTTPSEWLCNSTERTMEFEIAFQADMDEGVIRCDIHNPLTSSTTHSNNETIELIPGDICSKTDLKVIHHPKNCKKHVTCYGEPEGYEECEEMCVKINNGNSHSCVDCNEDVCPKEDTRTVPVTTTSGPSLLMCNDISGYTDDSASVQCQITSNDFDTIFLSHMSSSGSDLVSLGSLTKAPAVVTTTDPLWDGLDLVYNMDGSLKYINVSIPKVACEMDGMFYLNLTNGNLSSVATSQFNVLEPPVMPSSLSLTFASVGENNAQTFTCEGEIGTNQGTLTLEIFDKSSEQFNPITSVNSPTDQKNGCMVTRTIKTNSFLSFSQNGTVARCSASLHDIEKAKDVIITSDNVTLLVIPLSVCEPNDTKVANPYDCYRYVTCGDGGITDQPCGVLCFNPVYSNCSTQCDHCNP
ncbi:uncharacterized protein LOC132550786, partial [Ylistrum balloti]|uniref:uncharacterized protein LOC132550786 n=1 Tax=Ylistrum balloti TaxID=509963 RepID=UPI002905BA77